jgi:hypothetical protein
MTDEQLTAYLHLTPAESEIVIPKLSPQRRATYERMASLETEIFLWQNGLGPKPTDVLMDFPRKAFR